MLHHLPLSWARAPVAEPRLHYVSLALSRLTWIPTAEIPFDIAFEQIFRDYLLPLPRGFVLQFCNEDLSRFVIDNGGKALQIGLEALLPLQQQPWDRPSLWALARRGRRGGTVQELLPSPENQRKLKELMASTPYAHRPQLALAFRTRFDNTVRCFAFVSPGGQWQAAVTLSQVSAGYLHTELLLRHRRAPAGAVEALITGTAETLLAQGLHTWSLGGVPFARRNQPAELVGQPLKTMAVNSAGRLFKFAYNYEGLFKFKDKFRPQWRPLFLCAAPNFPWRVLADLAFKMNYLQLVTYSAWNALTPG